MLYNYPVTEKNSNQVFSSEEDFIRYLKNYPFFTTKIVFIRNEHFNTRHTFTDGLTISLLWKLNDKTLGDLTRHLEGRTLNIYEILGLQSLGWLICIKGEVWQYSNSLMGDMPEPLLRDIVSTRMYQTLEFEVSKPSTLPDFLFDMLISENDLLLKFKQYLENRELD